MRINEIVTETELSEAPSFNKIGTGIGKAVGAAAKGVGAVAGGIAGIPKAIKKGYQAGKATVGGAGDEPTDASTGTVGKGVSQGLAKLSGTDKTAPAAAAGEPGAETAAKSLDVDKLSTDTKQSLIKTLQTSVEKDQAAAAKPAQPAAEPSSGAGTATAGATAAGQPRVEPDLNAPAPSSAAQPAAAAPAAAPAAQPANKAASDTFEKAKGDMRKVASGTKPLPDNMAQGVQADIAKMAKGDKESGVAAAQKIMGLAQRGMDVAALQQAWTANAKAGERFLSQSVYRSITNMLREHGMIWSDLNLRVRIDESVNGGVFLRYAKPVTENVQLFRIR